MTVDPVNDNNPVFTADITPSVAENQVIVQTLTATDADLPAQTIGYTVVGGADGALFTITGTDQLEFLTAPDFDIPGDADGDNVYDVTIQLDDGNGGIETQSISVAILNVNEAPINTLPGSQVTNEDSPLVFSIGNGNRLSIADPDASGELEVTLSVADGTLTLSSTAGLTATSGNGTDNVVLQGTQAAINTAIEGLQYIPNASFVGVDSLSISTDDLGSSGSGGPLTDVDALPINVNGVNDAPTIALGVDQLVDEDAGAQTVAAFATGFSAGGGPDEAAQTIADFVVSNDNPTLFSVQPDVDNAGNLTWTPAPDAVGTATVTVQVRDSGGTANGGVDLSSPQQFAITIDPVNDAPGVALGADQIVDEDAGAQTVSGFVTGFTPG